MLCSIFPICSDDFPHSFIWWTEDRVGNLSDICVSMTRYYTLWGGRIVAHSLVQYFLSHDKVWFDMANTGCYLFVGFLISRLARPYSFRYFALIISVLWFILPIPGSTMLWLTGSFNYLWAGMLNMLFLVLLLSDDKRIRWLSVPVALLAGNSHEGISLCMLGCIATYMFLTRKDKKDFVFILAVSFLIVGLASNIMAPGTSERMSKLSAGTPFITRLANIVQGYGSTAIHTLCCHQDYLACFIMIPASAMANAYTYIKKRTIHKLSLALLAGAIFGSFAPIAANTLYCRAFWGVSFFAFASMSAIALPAVAKVPRAVYLLTLYFLITCNLHFIHLSRHEVREFRKIEEDVQTQAEQGKHIIILDELPKSRFIEAYGYFKVHTYNSHRARLLGTRDISIFFKNDNEAELLEHLDEILPDCDFEHITYKGHHIFRSPYPVTTISAYEQFDNKASETSSSFSSFIHNEQTYVMVPDKGRKVRFLLQYTNGKHGERIISPRRTPKQAKGT